MWSVGRGYECRLSRPQGFILRPCCLACYFPGLCGVPLRSAYRTRVPNAQQLQACTIIRPTWKRLRHYLPEVATSACSQVGEGLISPDAPGPKISTDVSLSSAAVVVSVTPLLLPFLPCTAPSSTQHQGMKIGVRASECRTTSCETTLKGRGVSWSLV